MSLSELRSMFSSPVWKPEDHKDGSFSVQIVSAGEKVPYRVSLRESTISFQCDFGDYQVQLEEEDLVEAAFLFPKIVKIPDVENLLDFIARCEFPIEVGKEDGHIIAFSILQSEEIGFKDDMDDIMELCDRLYILFNRVARDGEWNQQIVALSITDPQGRA